MFNMKLLCLGGLRTLRTYAISSPKAQKNYAEFMKVFPTVLRNLTEFEEETINKRMIKVLELIVPKGTECRGVAVASAYKSLENPAKLTNENIKLANILGWCLEIDQAFVLIQNDIFDASEAREGAPYLYKNEDVGLTAFNGSVILKSSIFCLLKQYFSFHPFYVHIMELFREINLTIAMGQLFEAICVNKGKTDLIGTFTQKKYYTLLRYKVAPFAFLFPVNLSLCLAEKFDLKNQQQLEPILTEMGQLVQVSNDFYDSFGDLAVTDKIDTGIKQGKFTWLITTALEIASPAQRRVLSQNYGKDCLKAVGRVKQIYDDLDMREVFEEYERRKLKYFETELQRISPESPHKSLLEYLINSVEPTIWKEQKWWA